MRRCLARIAREVVSDPAGELAPSVLRGRADALVRDLREPDSFSVQVERIDGAYTAAASDEGEGVAEIWPVLTVVHNPFAAFPMPADFVGATPQFVSTQEGMQWIVPEGGEADGGGRRS